MTTPARYTLVARIHGFQGDYARAVDVASEGLRLWPQSTHLYRHRGEFRIVLRDFIGARKDLERAATLSDEGSDEVEFYRGETMKQIEALLMRDIEPPYVPVTDVSLAELTGTYKSSLRSSAWYHLALTGYLLGDFKQAAREFTTALGVAIDDDMKVAATAWLYMSLRRAEDPDSAKQVIDALPAEPRVLAPNYLRRVRLYLGQVPAEGFVPPEADRRTKATLGYGLGSWLLDNGDVERAREVLQQVLEVTDETAFGYIAAEQDLARLAPSEATA